MVLGSRVGPSKGAIEAVTFAFLLTDIQLQAAHLEEPTYVKPASRTSTLTDEFSVSRFAITFPAVPATPGALSASQICVSGREETHPRQ